MFCLPPILQQLSSSDFVTVQYCPQDISYTFGFVIINKTTLADGYCPVNPVLLTPESYNIVYKTTLADGYCPINPNNI